MPQKNNPSSLIARRFWEKGYPLRKALFAFAHPSLREQYEAIDASRPKLGDQIDSLAPMPEGLSMSEGFQKLHEHLRPAFKGSRELSQALDEMRQNVLSLTRAGHLKAYGFEPPRRVNDQPIELPLEMWSGRIEWDASKAMANGLEFIEVRMLPDHWEPQLIERLANEGIDKSKHAAGRPTVKAYIQQAYEALRAIGSIDYEQPMTVLCEQIRNWLAAQYPQDSDRLSNLRNETIRRLITDQFKSDKALH